MRGKHTEAANENEWSEEREKCGLCTKESKKEEEKEWARPLLETERAWECPGRPRPQSLLYTGCVLVMMSVWNTKLGTDMRKKITTNLSVCIIVYCSNFMNECDICMSVWVVHVLCYKHGCMCVTIYYHLWIWIWESFHLIFMTSMTGLCY